MDINIGINYLIYYIMENQELIKQVTEKAEQWLTPAYDAETQAEVKRMLENEDKPIT